ncbi:MAG: zinc ribbon domain-containing protein [Gammaproteobacteria bacterium]|nr:zinc ribbon domain-containing protein [Gammaproteobacteria bacterium]
MFCGVCGEVRDVTRCNCGFVNESKQTFCGNCGRNLVVVVSHQAEEIVSREGKYDLFELVRNIKNDKGEVLGDEANVTQDDIASIIKSLKG